MAARPLLGEHPDIDSLWAAEAVGPEHSAGVELARWLVDGQPSLALHGCDLARFSAKPGRSSPFHERQIALGACFGSVDGWARPERYPAEAAVTRERVAMFDLTSEPRLAVTGPGALPFLQAMTTSDLAKAPGAVTPTLLLGEDGGVRGCLVVARLGDERFHVGAGGRLDSDGLRRHLPRDGTVQIDETTSGTCCLGLRGPLAGEVLPELSTTDLSAEETSVGDVPVAALRLSTVGEPGWELHTTEDFGRQLWDTLRDRGVAVRMDKGYFLGRDALAPDPATPRARPSRSPGFPWNTPVPGHR